jgi:hypothetical protein
VVGLKIHGFDFIISGFEAMTWDIVLMWLMAIAAMAFIFFSISMLYDQIQGLKENSTTIDTYKEMYGRYVRKQDI